MSSQFYIVVFVSNTLEMLPINLMLFVEYSSILLLFISTDKLIYLGVTIYVSLNALDVFAIYMCMCSLNY